MKASMFVKCARCGKMLPASGHGFEDFEKYFTATVAEYGKVLQQPCLLGEVVLCSDCMKSSELYGWACRN